MKLYIDTDNAMGSPRGDIDDGFALAFLLRQKRFSVVAVGSVGGNTTAQRAYENNRKLASVSGYSGPILKSVEVDQFIPQVQEPLTAVALGPLTHFARSLGRQHFSSLILVGSHSTSRGKYPPFWPYEFNFTKDRSSTYHVFKTETPLVVVPLDIAKRLQIRLKEVEALSGELGTYLLQNSRRWFLRARLLKASGSVPLWDLVAAVYTCHPELFEVKKRRCQVHPNGWVEYHQGDKEVSVVTDYDPKEVWKKFASELS